eukprot:XP_001706653.1 VSP [Giardia lamblia ATCC 50803]
MLYSDSDSDSAMWCGGDSGGVGLFFMGGCYKTESQPGSDICTAASNGVCTTCKADNGLFKNPVTPQKPGSECILCSDTKGADGYTGVANCLKCTEPTNSPGAATCTECQEGYYKENNECNQCDQSCLTCSGSGPNHCTSCKEGKYLKSDNTCSPTCEGNTYADPVTRTCKESGIADCTACEYNTTVSKPQCTACNNKKVKTELDGTTTCVDDAGCATDNVDGSHFLSDDSTKCILCSDTTTGTEANDKGIANCKTCKKNGAKPTCSACLDGYFGSDTCTACGANCATCSAAGNDQCTKCKPGFFMKQPGSTGECVACDSKADNGIEGCSACTNDGGAFKCTDCKPNYRKEGSTGSVTCTKTCEDDTTCGGTSGACDAMIIDDQGTTKHYCSYCGDSSQAPIDGLCATDKNGNTCTNNVCTSCTQGYFLYMDGCYSTQSQPGNLMCKTANNGVCTAVNENNKYFIVPEAKPTQQSVLACGNPLGTLVDTKAYVGVDGCSQCTAPTAPSEGGMTPAVCTSCDSGKKPNRDGTGCVTCSDTNCKSCAMDGVCGECNSGFSLDNGKCVSTGANRSGLSTGAIAGISVAVVVVVGGLVGFLCWWFVCRGKA